MTRRAAAILAHPDDEYSLAPLLAAEVAQGTEVWCVYLTDGGGNNSSPAVRREESIRALRDIGIKEEWVLFPGLEQGIQDGLLFERLDEAYEAVLDTFREREIDALFCLAWEGGHQDHDAAHLVALAFARARGLLDNTWEFSLYNGYQRPWKLFRVLELIPNGQETRSTNLGIARAVELSLLCLHYRSQWKSWIGLFPAAFLKLAILRRARHQRIQLERIHARPHAGPLFYERRFGVSYDVFREKTSVFLNRYVIKPLPDPAPKSTASERG